MSRSPTTAQPQATTTRIGRIASLTDQAGSLSRSYDERGNIITDARTIASQLYSNAYTYESAGRLSADHLRLFRLESGLHPRQRRADYDRHHDAARPRRDQPRHERHAYALRPGRLPDIGQRRDRRPHLRSRLPDDEREGRGTGNIQYLSYGYDADNNVHTHHGQRDPGQ